jgi:hypothetical protein
MARPTDWSCLGYAKDPVPGDPQKVYLHAVKLSNTAAAITTAKQNLTNLTMQANNKGKAIEKILEDINAVKVAITKVESRFEDASDALDAYYPELDDAQDKSLAAWNKADPLKEVLEKAQKLRDSYHKQYNKSIDPEEREDLKDLYVEQVQKIYAANVELNKAKQKVEEAIAERDQAAEKCIQYFCDINWNSCIKDTWWDGITDLFEEIWKAVWPIIDAITQWIGQNSWWLSLVAAVFAVIPGLEPLGAIIMAAIKVSKVIQTLKKGVIATITSVKAYNGEASFEDAAIAWLDFAVSYAECKLYFKASAFKSFNAGSGSNALSNATTGIKAAAFNAIKKKWNENCVTWITKWVVNGFPTPVVGLGTTLTPGLKDWVKEEHE